MFWYKCYESKVELGQWQLAIQNPTNKTIWVYCKTCIHVVLGYIYIYTGWWFGTWLLFSISYMGWDNPSHWRSPIFQDGYCTTNQIGNSMFGHQLISDETLMTRSACLTCLCNWTHSWVHFFFCTSIQRNIRTNRTNNRQLPKPLTQLKSSSSEDIYCLNQKQSRDLRCVEAWR